MMPPMAPPLREEEEEEELQLVHVLQLQLEQLLGQHPEHCGPLPQEKVPEEQEACRCRSTPLLS
jgi:hypothetical protein